MIPRRYMLGSGVLGGVVGLLGSTDAAAAPDAAPQQLSERSLDGIVHAVESLRDEMRTERSFQDIQAIRTAQKNSLIARGKFPDFIEVGADVWFALHDWQIRWQQPIAMTRDANGRYTLVLLQTVVILRPDMPASYVGDPYEKQA